MKTSIKKQDIVILGILIVFVFLISEHFFLNQSLRMDEAQSLFQTGRSLPATIKLVAKDVHVPFYHIVLHFWQAFFGNEVRAARILSLIFFMLTIPVTYFLGQTTYGRSVALFSAGLVTFSPFMNWYGNEIRMYSLFTLLTTANLYFLVKIYQSNNKQERNPILWCGYFVTALLGSFTHYFFIVFLASQAAFILMNYKIFKNILKYFVIAGVFVAVAFISWVVFVLNSGELQNAQPVLAKPATINIFNTFSSFILGFQDDFINTIFVAAWPTVTLFTFLMLSKKTELSLHTALFMFTVFIPIILLYLISVFFAPIYLTRYFMFAIPLFYLLIGWILSAYESKKLSLAFRAILISIMIFGLVNQAQSNQTPIKENYKQVAQFLDGHATSRDIIVVSPPFTIYPIEYYYNGSSRITTLPIWDRSIVGPIPLFSTDKLPEDILQISKNHQTLWILTSFDQGYEDELIGYLDTHFELTDQRKFSSGMRLHAYKLKYDSLDYEAAILKLNRSFGNLLIANTRNTRTR